MHAHEEWAVARAAVVDVVHGAIKVDPSGDGLLAFSPVADRHTSDRTAAIRGDAMADEQRLSRRVRDKSVKTG